MPVTCITSEYDLTGTPRDSRCPECGMSAEASYHNAENPPRRSLHPAILFAFVISAIGSLLLLGPIVGAEGEFIALAFAVAFLAIVKLYM